MKEKIDSLLELYHQAAYESPMLTKFFFANLFKTILEASNFVLETKQVQLQQLLQVKKFSDIAPFLDNLLQKLTDRQEVINDDGNDYVREAKKYILNYYNQELNLEAIASTINISPKYLSDLFIREEGIGISKYLKQIRMEKAQDLLQNSTLRVGEISDQVGFSSHSYFIRNFRELFQMTPDAYRKMNRQVKK
ncbi:helix-turn-helix transcriptional regulator [Enterococcus alcedinis]|uniref:helix-turn-helix transcriptional regulator n=1 Tax=Enterococcus alcedinis TaxID=1274384 RepID=UPI0036168A03